MLTDIEKRELKFVLMKVFGEKARHWEINEDSVRILSEMMEKARTCSQAVNSLPKVPGWQPGLGFIPSQIIGALYREIRNGKNSILETCNTVQLSPYAAAFEMASLGLPVHFPVCY
ncbi:hypothetical protein [Desulfuromonas sp. CSMB_57]|jgi:hypothetical protein|uniref:hypothetical protein n=1 Tax=Desulfuromonas sp. CSMB_57 TaxID=2807629 RepID=UPI001CD3F594|nr:hypothetical protein [Desulfuromonas sp. CSMB_57]